VNKSLLIGIFYPVLEMHAMHNIPNALWCW